MYVASNLIEKFTVAITLGNSKESLGIPLTPYESDFFDRLAAEIGDLQAQGFTIDVAPEIPDVAVAAP